MRPSTPPKSPPDHTASQRPSSPFSHIPSLIYSYLHEGFARLTTRDQPEKQSDVPEWVRQIMPNGRPFNDITEQFARESKSE